MINLDTLALLREMAIRLKLLPRGYPTLQLEQILFF